MTKKETVTAREDQPCQCPACGSGDKDRRKHQLNSLPPTKCEHKWHNEDQPRPTPPINRTDVTHPDGTPTSPPTVERLSQVRKEVLQRIESITKKDVFCPSCGWDISTELAGEAQGEAPQKVELRNGDVWMCICGDEKTGLTWKPVLSREQLMQAIAGVEAGAHPSQDAHRGPLCDNCGKSSRLHYCWRGDDYKGEVSTYHPSELRGARSTPSPDPQEEK